MQKDWERLGRELKRARTEHLGFSTLAAFQRARGLSHEKTIASLERGEPAKYRKTTLTLAEQWYGLMPGNITEILDGGPVRYRDDADDVTPPGKAALAKMVKEISEGMNEDQLAELRATWEADGRRLRREVGL